MSAWLFCGGGTACGRKTSLLPAAVFALATFACMTARAADGEWPRFRGPGGAGVSDATTVPVKFTDADYNWVTKLPGKGRSSPVVWGGKVFVTSAQDDAGKRHLLCLGTRDGRILWKKSFDFRPYRVHTLNSHAASTPALDSQRVYVLWPSPGSVVVVAIDHEGRERWRRDLGPFSAQHGPGTSPAVIGRTLVVGNDQEGNESFLIGLDCATGRIKWQRKRRNSKAAYSTPAELVRNGRSEAVFTSTSHGVTSLDPATGKLLWEASGVFKQRCVSSPVIVKGLVFATAGSGGAGKEAVAVRPPSAKGGRAEVAYRFTKDLPYVPTAVTAGELLFMLAENGNLTCARAASGEVVWRERLDGKYYASPVCVGDRVYLVTKKGDVVAVRASEKYEFLGRSSLGEASDATPAISRGVMYLRTDSRVISLGGRAKP